MIQSMTGYGKASGTFAHKKITVEIKSLNSKSQDLNTRIIAVYREKELVIRNQVLQALERGKIDFSLNLEWVSDDSFSKINTPLVTSYINQLQAISPQATNPELLAIALRLPDVLKQEKDVLDENEWLIVQQTITQAINNLIQFRNTEGAVLAQELTCRIENIRKYLDESLQFDKERTENVKTKLLSALSDLKVSVDENRLEQELIYYLEKLDITEEKVRLANHLNYFIETLNEPQSNGRKLGFICQEIGREINTLGSKANHSEMQKRVVNMKDELEKIKEQLLNIL